MGVDPTSTMMVITTTDETTEAEIEEATTEANSRRANSTWSPSTTTRHSPLLAERSNLHNETVLFTSRLDYRRFFKTIIIRSLLTIYKLQSPIIPISLSSLLVFKQKSHATKQHKQHHQPTSEYKFLHMTHGL